MAKKKINELTREVYHEQHKKIAEDHVSMERFMSMINPEYFGVPEDYFIGKNILDAGCGDTAKLSIKFAKMGAKVTAFDLGKDFIEVAKNSAKRQGLEPGSIQFLSANVESLPFRDSQFDFVCCHGVLLHLADFSQFEKAFSELARVTKINGYLYTVFGVYGGFLEDCIIPAARDYYNENPDFKKLIDNISPEDFDQTFDLMKKVSSEFNIGLPIGKRKFQQLFDIDFCVMLQNLLQPPVRLKLNEDYIKRCYKRESFQDAIRLKRFVKRQNIRIFTAPLHYEHENPISKIFYGSGNLEFLAKKL